MIITGELTNSPWLLYQNTLSVRCTLMILHLARMRRNVNRKVYNDRKNVSATPSVNEHDDRKAPLAITYERLPSRSDKKDSTRDLMIRFLYERYVWQNYYIHVIHFTIFLLK